MRDTVKKIIGTVAPTAATMLGGPLAGMATRELSQRLLGKDSSDESEIEQLLLSGDPDAMVRLKEVESNLKTRMKELEIDANRINMEDRSSARRRQVDMHDWTPNVLGVGIIIGYFVTQYIIFTKVELTEDLMPVVMRMLGILDAMILAVIYFFYGSSSGDKDKEHAMEDLLKRK